MLGIKIKGKFLSLFDNVALTFDMVHPFGIITDARNILKGGYSFPIDIPLDEINVSVIGHVHRMDNHAVIMRDEYCEVWSEGILLYPGKATVKKATNTTATLFMVFNEMKEFTGTSLSEIDYGGDREIGEGEEASTNHAQDTVENPLDHDYVFAPVLNPSIAPQVWHDQFPGLEPQQKYWQNFYSSDDAHFAWYPVTTIMPFIRLDYMLSRVFRHEGYTLDNLFQDTDELKQILIYNNYNINTHGAPGESSWDSTINLRNHVPVRNSVEFVLAVVGTFALGLFPDPWTKSIKMIPLDDIIRGPVTADWTSRASVNYEHSSDLNYIGQWRFGVSEDDELSVRYSLTQYPQADVLGEGLTPPIMHAAMEWFKRYSKSDNSYYFLFPVTFKTVLIAQEHRYVIKDEKAEMFTSELIPMWNSESLLTDGQISVDRYVLTVLVEEGVPYQQIMVPQIQHKGFVKPYPDQQTLCTSFRMMIFRGMQPCLAGVEGFEDYVYPMAHVTEYNINGDVVGDHSLLWHGDRGIYAKYWKALYETLANKKEVIRKLNLTIADIMKFRFYHKIRIENQNYIITRLRFTLTHQGLSVTEATMITTL